MNNTMAINTYIPINNWLKTKINEHTEQKQTHRYREHFDGCHMARGLGEKGEGIKKYKLVVAE